MHKEVRAEADHRNQAVIAGSFADRRSNELYEPASSGSGIPSGGRTFCGSWYRHLTLLHL